MGVIIFAGVLSIISLVGVGTLIRNLKFLRSAIRVKARIVGYKSMPQSDEDIFSYRAIYELRAKGQTVRVTSDVGVTELEIKPEGTEVVVLHEPGSQSARATSRIVLIGLPIAHILLGILFGNRGLVILMLPTGFRRPFNPSPHRLPPPRRSERADPHPPPRPSAASTSSTPTRAASAAARRIGSSQADRPG
jgi:hypothetical protein